MTIWESIDQAPVLLKHFVLGLLPEVARPLASMLISASSIIAVFAGLFAVITLLERKGLGRIQNRPGPNRVGPWGILQPVADGIKMLVKEDIVPRDADKVLHFLAPIALMIPSLLVYSVLPLGRNLTAIDYSAGVLLFLALGASSELAIFMAGWGSRNKYSLLGAIRAIAQMVSYELPMVLGAIAVVMAAGTLDTAAIVEKQAGGFWHWHAFSPWGAVGFVSFLICALAESNRAPFDLPEAESELIAGHLTEYSGFKYALFFMAEYLGMMAISAFGITLFLGGWWAPFPFLDFLPSWLWFFSKLLAMVVLFIWIRGTLPRLRADQLMGLAWKGLMPLALVNLLAVALWVKLPAAAGWAAGLALLGTTAAILRRVALRGRPRPTPRVYTFAD
jgi:NADH-quinone oxidoreductase subunit H